MSAESMTADTAVGKLVNEFVTRGAFRAAALPADKSGSESFSLIWFQNQQMKLMIDNRQSKVCLVDVLPTIASRTTIDRELRSWLRERADKKLPEHRRLDPKTLQAKLTNKSGRMQLTIASLDNDLLFATRKLLHLTNELYLEFLSAPERYSWIVESFELDPDNPRWP